MARFAGGFKIKPRDRITPGNDAVVRPARLRHQYVFVARSLGLDDITVDGVPTSSSGVKQHRDRQRRP